MLSRFCWVLMMLAFSAMANANVEFTIPRSTVVELQDKNTDLTYPIFIKLPKSYRANTTASYPVIYLLDGSYAFQVVSGATRFPMNSGAMEQAIIVAISYSKGSKGAASRVRDYTPYLAEDWKLETGKAALHADFINNTVFTYISNNYRVEGMPRTIVGNSLGGLFSAYVLFSRPSMFNNYIIGSPSVWFHDNAILSEAIVPAKTAVNVYLSVGALERPEYGERQDMVEGAQKLAQKITQQSEQQINLKFKLIDEATHATAFPTTAIQGLDWLYGSRQEK
ncbi:alpha/beta hydrolase-fold protein [Alteromonas sp. 1_MG-2023]|uniref:alpha/beta hydrolase n=1 Tax=Alteromonas sp. 1_MG-2023 TaxID=3062669 RepID=UPI0026E17119|nr:alpha/beta hydrolase-fold protein [Alteromonas sp. 1_MG-2023]MDO6567050.1 alpha/beta hydrolase-fold protein [Alteromonas sp. 1_MG-2023]